MKQMGPYYHFFFYDIFLMWSILTVILNLLQYCFCFGFGFFWQRGMWDLNSPTRGQTCTLLEGSVLTTEPLGKSPCYHFFSPIIFSFFCWLWSWLYLFFEFKNSYNCRYTAERRSTFLITPSIYEQCSISATWHHTTSYRVDLSDIFEQDGHTQVSARHWYYK